MNNRLSDEDRADTARMLDGCLLLAFGIFTILAIVSVALS